VLVIEAIVGRTEGTTTAEVIIPASSEHDGAFFTKPSCTFIDVSWYCAGCVFFCFDKNSLLFTSLSNKLSLRGASTFLAASTTTCFSSSFTSDREDEQQLLPLSEESEEYSSNGDEGARKLIGALALKAARFALIGLPSATTGIDGIPTTATTDDIAGRAF